MDAAKVACVISPSVRIGFYVTFALIIIVDSNQQENRELYTIYVFRITYHLELHSAISFTTDLSFVAKIKVCSKKAKASSNSR